MGRPTHTQLLSAIGGPGGAPSARLGGAGGCPMAHPAHRGTLQRPVTITQGELHR